MQTFPRFRITQTGDDEILNLIANGSGEVNGTFISLENISKEFKAEYNKTKQALGSKLKEWDNSDLPFNRPEYVKVSKVDVDSSLLSKYDEVVSSIFRIFGSTPTNKLSRSPAFRQFYLMTKWKNLHQVLQRLH